MEKNRFADAAFMVCDEITNETTRLYEALADIELEEAKKSISLIEEKLYNIKVRLDEV